MSGGPIWILGTGVYGRAPLPTSLAARLTNVRTVYSRIPDDPASWLPQELRHAEFISLASVFRSVDRFDNFSRVANAVIAGAKEPAEVVYYTPGSPVVYERPVPMIQEIALKSGIQCHIIPAVSCIDAILTFLGEDVAPALQVVEARWLVKSNAHCDPRVNLLLLQLDAFSTDAVPTRTGMTMESLLPLGVYLQRTLPSDHPVLFVQAPLPFAADSGYVFGSVVGKIGALRTPSNLQGLSLFVPSLLNADREKRTWRQKYTSSMQDSLLEPDVAHR